MLNHIEYFWNVILIVHLEFRHIGGVHWHFIHVTCSDERPAVLPLQRVSAKREQMSHRRSIVLGSACVWV